MNSFIFTIIKHLINYLLLFKSATELRFSFFCINFELCVSLLLFYVLFHFPEIKTNYYKFSDYNQ